MEDHQTREGLFRTLFESSPDAIFIEDLNGFVLDCNPAAAELHGTVTTEIIGKHVSELVPPEQRNSLVTDSPETPTEFEGLSLRVDGVSVPVCIRTRRIEYLGQPALLLHVRGIAERKRLEEEMRRNNDELEQRVQHRTAALARANEILREEITERERAERDRDRFEEQTIKAQKMEAVGRLAGGVAHDFNNLLTIIIGRCDVLIGKLSTNHPLRPDLVLIQDAAQRAASVTRQLLAFSRKQVLQPKVLNLNTVIQSMDSMLRSLISENIELTEVLDPELSNVEADRGQLEQVIMNLVVNALDAMPDGGALQLQTSTSELEDPLREHAGNARLKHRYAVFSVRDSGRGMDRETLSHIFEPFFTTKENSKGTGLGLSTVYGIVKQSGGYISAASESGKGSTFTIYLPAVQAPADPVENRHEKAPRGTETILLAEDADVVRRLAREILENQGYTIIDAPNGEEALRLCETYVGTIHLTLSDVVMPKMNGRELAEKAVRLRPEMKVLLMSGYTDHIVEGGILHPGVHFIAKPFTSNSLALKVREVLDSSL